MRALLLVLLSAATLTAQPLPRTDDWVYDPRVRTVQCFRGANELSYPILAMGEEPLLTLEFDVVGTGEADDLSYRIVHCDADWRPSVLQPLEFLDGFASDRIQQVSPSLATRVDYVHYRVRFPSQGARFKVSGNYLLIVHRSDDEAAIVLVRRFVVAERAVSIAPNLGFTPRVNERFRLQQLAFAVQPGGLPLLDPLRELKVVLLQNFRWDAARTLERPAYVYPTYLEYAFDAANEFLGGNEFRTLDLRSTRRPGLGVDDVMCADTCRARLSPERPRAANAYYSNPDLNGAFVTGLIPDDTRWGVFESDYVLAEFRLQTGEPVGDVYVFGALSNWHLLPHTRLFYDASTGSYVGRLLLKQGVYNYQYAVGRGFPPLADEATLEGSHVETENAYAILVYYRRLGDRFDRLVGLRLLGSYD